MKYTKNIIILQTVLISIVLYACNSCDNSAIKDIPSAAKVYRFDNFFYSINTHSDLDRRLLEVKQRDSQFYNLYLDKIYSIERGGYNFNNTVFRHINSAQNQEIRKNVQKSFGDFRSIEDELSLLSRYYQLHYPNRKFPKINFCYSGFAGFMAWLYNDSNMLVDLDMYLGSDFEAYPQFYPQFKFTYYSKEYLVQNIGRELIRREFLLYEKDKPNNMLALMLIEGAKLYELHKLMPCREEHKLFEYSEKQWEWAKVEEGNIWKYLIKEDLLFESDFNEYKTLVGEAPASLRSGVADGAPPRIAIFAGYQIIKRYMEREGGKNTYEIFKNNKPEDILKKAKYNP